MANPDSVGQNTQDNFGTYRLGQAKNVLLSATANAVGVIPMLSGGMGGSGSYAVRRITVCNPYNTAGGTVPNGAAANVTIGFDNAGGNLVSNTISLTNLTAVNTFVDIALGNGLVAAANYTAYANSTMFVNVTANVANLGVQVNVYGDVISF